MGKGVVPCVKSQRTSSQDTTYVEGKNCGRGLRRITLASRCYYGLSKQLSKVALSRKTKTSIYKSLIMPVLLCGAEAWTLTKSDEHALGVFERKILRNIYGLYCDNGEWRIQWNHELYEIYGDVDIAKRIKIHHLG